MNLQNKMVLDPEEHAWSWIGSSFQMTKEYRFYYLRYISHSLSAGLTEFTRMGLSQLT